MGNNTEEPKTKEIYDTPTIKMYQDIVDRAHTEVEGVRRVYYHFTGLITIIITVGIAVFSFVSYKSVQDLKADMKEEVKSMKEKAALDYAVLAAKLSQGIESNAKDVERRVDTRIDSEFDRDNIQGLVKDKAQERIDKVADVFIGQHVESKITPQIKAVDKSLKEMVRTVEFNAVLSAAQNDDISAFQTLRGWAKEKGHPLKEKAEQSVNAIISSKSALDSYVMMSYPTPRSLGPSPALFNIEMIRDRYLHEPLPGERVLLIEYLKQRNDISNKDKLSFIAEVLRLDKSLDVALHAAEQFNSLSGQQIDVYNIKGMVDWYTKNSRQQ